MRFSATFWFLSAVLALGACAAPDTESFRAPDVAALFAQRTVSNYKDKVLPPVSPEDLVDASGRCAAAMVPAAAGDPSQGSVSLPQAGVPMIPSAIALEMSECDVVKRAGFPERTEIGSNEAGERTVTLTYINGQRPGIYTFRAGRLASMERAPEPTSAKPAKKTTKPAKRAARPEQVSVQ